MQTLQTLTNQNKLQDNPRLTPSTQLALNTSESSLIQAVKLCQESTLQELLAEESRLLSKLYRASPEEIITILGKLLVHYSLGNSLTESQEKSLFSDYVEDLGEYPAEVIHEAAKQYRRSPESNFFPKIGQLRGLCDARVLPVRSELKKVQRLIKAIREEDMDKAITNRPSHEQWKHLREALREIGKTRVQANLTSGIMAAKSAT